MNNIKKFSRLKEKLKLGQDIESTVIKLQALVGKKKFLMTVNKGEKKQVSQVSYKDGRMAFIDTEGTVIWEEKVSEMCR